MPLHPFIQAMLEQLVDRPALSAGSPAEARAMVAKGRAALGAGVEMYRVRDIEVPSRAGTVPARLLSPSESPIGVVVYLHGGGWVVGAPDDYDVLGRALAAESGCAVIIPDYRLAPEHPFPSGLEDCEDVLLWAHDNRENIASGGAGLIVAGDSAGANLATVALRRKPLISASLQVLIYPVTDCGFSSVSYRAHGTGLPLTSADMKWFFELYAPKSDWKHPDISPLNATDLTGLPPAVVVLAEYDVLHDEGVAYAKRLQEEGGGATLRIAPGMTHGFIRLHNHVEMISDEIARIGAALRSAAEEAPSAVALRCQ